MAAGNVQKFEGLMRCRSSRAFRGYLREGALTLCDEEQQIRLFRKIVSRARTDPTWLDLLMPSFTSLFSNEDIFRYECVEDPTGGCDDLSVLLVDAVSWHNCELIRAVQRLADSFREAGLDGFHHEQWYIFEDEDEGFLIRLWSESREAFRSRSGRKQAIDALREIAAFYGVDGLDKNMTRWWKNICKLQAAECLKNNEHGAFLILQEESGLGIKLERRGLKALAKAVSDPSCATFDRDRIRLSRHLDDVVKADPDRVQEMVRKRTKRTQLGPREVRLINSRVEAERARGDAGTAAGDRDD